MMAIIAIIDLLIVVMMMMMTVPVMVMMMMMITMAVTIMVVMMVMMHMVCMYCRLFLQNLLPLRAASASIAQDSPHRSESLSLLSCESDIVELSSLIVELGCMCIRGHVWPEVTIIRL